MGALIPSVDPETLEHYLRWRTAKAWSSYLPKAFVDTSFEFYEKILSGTQELKPRWKRAMAMTESSLGEALGKLYCAKYFDESCKGTLPCKPPSELHCTLPCVPLLCAVLTCCFLPFCLLPLRLYLICCAGKALAIVENVRKALETRLKEVDWMLADSTRESARQPVSQSVTAAAALFDTLTAQINPMLLLTYNPLRDTLC